MTAELIVDGLPYSVIPGGQMDITKFDADGLSGTFEFKARGDAGEITVEGAIDYRSFQRAGM